MLNCCIISNHVLMISEWATNSLITIPHEQSDRLEGLPIGKNLEISAAVTDQSQHLDAAVARDTRNLADALLVKIFRIAVRFGRKRPPSPESCDQLCWSSGRDSR